MARARNSLPLGLRQLSFNNATGLYEAEEAGITYQLTYEQLNDLKGFYKHCGGMAPTFDAWYASLDRFAKKKIKRLGVAPPPDDFYPDTEYD